MSVHSVVEVCMEIVMLSDIHLRASAPSGRIDDFRAHMWDKLNQLVTYSNANGVSAIILGGDIFESVYVPFSVIKGAYNILKCFKGIIYVVYGNHDLKNHNYENRATSPLDLLIDITPNMELATNACTEIGENINLYGTSWNQEIPTNLDDDCFNILVIHKMVIKEKLWPGQKVGPDGKGSIILKKHNYDLIISGDNHQEFVLHNSGRYLVNSGSMCRTTIKQIDVAPGFYSLYIRADDTPKKPIKIPFKIQTDVFDIAKMREETQRADSLNNFTAFIETLAENRTHDKLSFSAIYNDLLYETGNMSMIADSQEIFKDIKNEN